VLLHHVTGPVQPPPRLLSAPWAPDQVTASSRASFSGLHEEPQEPAKDRAPSQQGCHGDKKCTTNPGTRRNRNLTCSTRAQGATRQLWPPARPALPMGHLWARQPPGRLELRRKSCRRAQLRLSSCLLSSPSRLDASATITGTPLRSCHLETNPKTPDLVEDVLAHGRGVGPR